MEELYLEIAANERWLKANNNDPDDKKQTRYNTVKTRKGEINYGVLAGIEKAMQ